MVKVTMVGYLLANQRKGVLLATFCSSSTFKTHQVHHHHDDCMCCSGVVRWKKEVAGSFVPCVKGELQVASSWRHVLDVVADFTQRKVGLPAALIPTIIP
jgi:tRNA U54 and U55 pseudouridine synthase Pus10